MKPLPFAAFTLLTSVLFAQAQIPQQEMPRQRVRMVDRSTQSGKDNSVVPIDGAFGFKLGEFFTPEPGTKPQLVGSLHVYRVTPKSPNAAFAIYEVQVNVASRKICAISAEGDAGADGSSYRKVQIFLAQKYGGDMGLDGTSFSKDGRTVTLESIPTGQNSSPRFKVIYSDVELCRAAHVDYMTMERSKLLEAFDGTGL